MRRAAAGHRGDYSDTLNVRLGLLGGTFDPPHVGHLLAAVGASEALSLDRLIFVPAARQPLKGGSVQATGSQRLEMLRSMIAGDPRFDVDPIEIERTGLSFSVETLAAYRARPEVEELFFIVGADVMASFHEWREPERVQTLAQLVILSRDAQPPVLAPWIRARRLDTRRVDISSSEVRARVRAQQSIRGFVPDSVYSYVAAAGLYR